jgi:hypothetical protein
VRGNFGSNVPEVVITDKGLERVKSEDSLGFCDNGVVRGDVKVNRVGDTVWAVTLDLSYETF